MRSHRSLTSIFALTLALVAASISVVDAGQASRTRSGGGGSRGSGSGGSSGVATRTHGSGGGQQVASGRATYRHGGYYGHHGYPYGYYGYPYYGHYGYYGHYHYGLYSYWWPWFNAYYVGYPAYYGYAPPPRNAPATVETKIKPKKAAVWIDGQPVGEARDYNGRWDRLRVPPGDHEVEFRAEGYMTLRVHLEAQPAGYYRIEHKLAHGEGLDPRSTEAPPKREPEPEPETRTEAPRASDPFIESAPPPRSSGSLAKGFLRIDVAPDDAAVYLDGRFLARGDELARLHGAIPVAEGTHTIEIVRPGYESESLDIEVAGREPVDVTIRLQRSAD
jgi:hypothetical protein